ncbi:MAG TPA: DUF885 family protein, partial [Candidatus Binatia bacterium]|nr:DUF885 family protein [Candidatus Binatia bacterium]
MRTLVPVLLASLLLACNTQPPKPAQPWPQFLDAFMEDYFRADPPFAVRQGRHEFDGQLPDWSRGAIEQRIAALKTSRLAAAGYDDAALTAQQRYEKQYLLSRIDSDLFWMDEVEQPFTNPAFYVNDEMDPSVYVARPYAPAGVRLKAFIAYARALPAAAAQIRANLRTPMPKTWVDLAQKSFDGYAAFFRKDVPKAFAGVKDRRLQRELKDAIGPAATAMDELAAWMKAEQARATDDFALG